MSYQGEARFKFEEGNPFITGPDEGEEASVSYRYRKWDLDNGIVLVARCEHDAAMLTPSGETQFLTIKALNEWDSKVFFYPVLVIRLLYFRNFSLYFQYFILEFAL